VTIATPATPATAGRPRLQGRPTAAVLPILAVVVLIAGVAITIVQANAGGTLGYDFLAYRAGAERVLHGRPLYEVAFASADQAGLFKYPPTFVVAVLPFALVDSTTAIWIWTAMLLGAFMVGVAILPVSARTRWLVLLLAGLDWPFLFAVKLGQVGPLLFLAFAAGWRWLRRPGPLGGAAAVGTAIKLQPGLVLAWAVATRRWRTVGMGAAVLAVLAIGATLAGGPSVWVDYLRLVPRVAEPVASQHNVAPQAIAYQLGLGSQVATAIGYASLVFVLAMVVVGIRISTPEASYLSVVVASQVLSPLQDHYALMLLLPVAWLLERRRRWAAAVPLVTSIFLVGVTPGLAYPLLFGLVLVVVVVDGAGRPRQPVQPTATTAPA
jgi:hypothetical protein